MRTIPTASRCLPVVLCLLLLLPAAPLGIPIAGVGTHSTPARQDATPGPTLTGPPPATAGPSSASRYPRVPIEAGAIPVGRFAVAQTVEATTGSVLPGNVRDTPNVAQPWGIDFDTNSSMLLVASVVSAQLDVVSPGAGTVVASVPIGGMPGSVIYDPTLNEAFVGDLNSNQLTVVSMGNDTVVHRITVGASPWDLAYDPTTDQIFAACANGIGVSVVDAANNTVVATVPTNGADGGLAYVPSLGEVFVGNLFSPVVYVFAVSNDSVVHTFHLPTATADLWYDNSTGDVLALTGNNTQGFLTQIAPTNESIVGSIPVGVGPYAVLSDGQTGQVFVSNYASNNLTVISGLNGSSAANVTSVPVGYAPTAMVLDPVDLTVQTLLPWQNEVVGVSLLSDQVVSNPILGIGASGIAVDPASGQLFVGDADSNRVTVLSGANYSVDARLQAGLYPTAFAYDTARQEMVVMNAGDPYVTFVNASTDAEVWNATTEFGMTSIAYDGGQHEIFYTTNLLNWVSEISDATYVQNFSLGTAVDPIGVTYDPGRGEVFVAQAGNDQVLILNDSNDSVVATVGVGSAPVAMAYDPATSQVFVVNSAGWNVSVISDQTNKVTAWVRVGGRPTDIAYDPAARSMLVANPYTNNVTVISDITDRVTSSVNVGYSPQSVAYDPSRGLAYVANEASGTVSVLSQNLTPIPATVTISSSPASCGGLTFNASAVSSGGNLSVLPAYYNATVAHCPGYLFSGWQATGSIRVVSASSLQTMVAVSANGTLTASFVLPPPPQYTITFAETGLQSGTIWGVTYAGLQWTASAPSTVVLSELNGSYNFTVVGISHYTSNRTDLTVNLTGAPVMVSIEFSKIVVAPSEFSIRFQETGLPSGTNWSATLDGLQSWSTSPSIVFIRSNGSYDYSIGPVANYTANSSSGTVRIAGQNQTILVVFVGQGTPTGIVTVPAPNPWATLLGSPVVIVGAVLGIVAVVVVVLVMKRRGRNREPPLSDAPVPESSPEDAT